jgi:hypothetical protein
MSRLHGPIMAGNRPLCAAVMYELHRHIYAGTLGAAIDRLPDLAKLGITR